MKRRLLSRVAILLFSTLILTSSPQGTSVSADCYWPYDACGTCYAYGYYCTGCTVYSVCWVGCECLCERWSEELQDYEQAWASYHWCHDCCWP